MRADPRRIMLLTFSRRAAAEMQRRVERIAGKVLGAQAGMMADALAPALNTLWNLARATLRDHRASSRSHHSRQQRQLAILLNHDPASSEEGKHHGRHRPAHRQIRSHSGQRRPGAFVGNRRHRHSGRSRGCSRSAFNWP
jgi:superfamily I DNA/RNA helicase